MPTIHIYGIDHSRAPVEIREQLTFCDAELQELLPELLTAPTHSSAGGVVVEAMVLSTCNRTEVYLVLDGEPTSYPLEPLRRYRPEVRLMEDECVRYHFRGREAANHLFAVAASLRSQLPGDTQISAQVWTAASTARRAGTLGTILERAVAAALRSAKRVRRETGLMAGGAETGPAVLRNLRQLVTPLTRSGRPTRVMILGAGVMAEEIATHLVRSGKMSAVARTSIKPPLAGKGEIEVTGVWARDRKKARIFATAFGVPSMSTGEAVRALASVDAVIGVCRGRVGLLSEHLLLPILKERIRPLVVVDLGIPRNLDPALAGRDGLQTVFLDQLHEQIKERIVQRGDTVKKAEAIVQEETQRFQQWMARWPLRPIRADVYGSLETVLAKWRTVQPAAVKHLRISIHRSLQQAFRTMAPGAESGLGRNP